MRSRDLLFTGIVFAFTTCVSAQAPSPVTARQGGEAAAEHAYQVAVKQGAPALRVFLMDFPKGANLHVHLSGAVYAETFIRDAAEDGLCIDPVKLNFVQPPCGEELVPASHFSGNVTPADQSLYDRLIDAFSMRSFVPSAGRSGHDHFFATFSHSDVLSRSHLAEWVDEVASRAAEQNNQYLELMETPPYSGARKLVDAIVGSQALEQGDATAFAQLRQVLLDKGLRDEVTADRVEAQHVEAGRKQLEHCGTPQAAPACRVEVRYLYQALRANAPERVFAQLLLGFETVQASENANDDTWVGINLVQPEDGFISMRDYTLQMKMIGYLHSVYPKVHISLHAGELAYGLVPPEGLTFHIRQAVELADAERIGHGVDLMYEGDYQGLLKEMVKKHVLVEINLSSNAAILGVTGANHPFPVYFAANVPVALSTDDEGVSRIDLTNEYVRAALEYNLTYRNLKKLARNGMEYDFLPGASLWMRPDDYEVMAKPCESATAGGGSPSARCQAFLAANQKAAAQWELEKRFLKFEAKF